MDGEHTTVATLDVMRQWIPSKLRRSFFQSVPPLAAGLREIKDAEEIGRIRAAAQLGCRLFEDLLTQIEPGKREIEVAAHLEFAARMAGAEGMSFETIVASGPRSALPHGHATEQRMPRRGFVGARLWRVAARILFRHDTHRPPGPATTAERDAYEAVLEAQLAAIAAVRPGVACGEVDEAARSVLRRAKLADFFTHSTGHGVGMEIHEGPRIAARQQQTLKAGMVITIEPGVYLPGRFGVRIEDMVLVTRARSGNIDTGDKSLD